MTQPTQQQSWIQDLLKRYRGMNPREGYEPVGFEFTRPPFDPRGFYKELEIHKNIGRAATNVVKQKTANRRMQEAQQAIDLSGVTPRYTGSNTSGAPGASRGKTPRLGSPLSNYNVSSGYGPRSRPRPGASTWHRGADLAAPSGTPIYATHDGHVGFSGWSNGYGYNITINGSGGMQTFYGHNSRNVVKPGQQVRRGQLIGYVGSTGVSTGPHLHYEVRINGQHVNPFPYL